MHKAWRIGVAVAMLWAAPGILWGQTGSQQSSGGANEAFASLDESLTRAADTLLMSADRIAVPAKAVVELTPGAAIDLRSERPPRSLLDGGSTLAATRLDLLRPTLDPILRRRGVPTELAAVVVVESAGRSMALSPKGARGLWQLMPDTARRYGLRVDEVRDDRIDLFKATDAAARYLHDLYAQFGDWKLALAAYNTGEGNVGSAILRAHTQDFDQLTNLRMLPLETRDYVPRVLATARFMGQSSALEEVHPRASAIIVFAVSNP